MYSYIYLQCFKLTSLIFSTFIKEMSTQLMHQCLDLKNDCTLIDTCIFSGVKSYILYCKTIALANKFIWCDTVNIKIRISCQVIICETCIKCYSKCKRGVQFM